LIIYASEDLDLVFEIAYAGVSLEGFVKMVAGLFTIQPPGEQVMAP